MSGTDFLPLLQEQTDFGCVIKNLVLILSHIHVKMNRVLQLPNLDCLTLGWNNSHLNLSPFSQHNIALVEISSHVCGKNPFYIAPDEF